MMTDKLKQALESGTAALNWIAGNVPCHEWPEEIYGLLHELGNSRKELAKLIKLEKETK